MSNEITFPTAETFYSIQGEGLWTGTPMLFVRLAGCNVGRYSTRTGVDLMALEVSPFQLLHPEYATCISFSNESFICDTDYRVKEHLSKEDIIVQLTSTGTHHINFTGGEPLIHKELPELIEWLTDYYQVHLETSGTLSIPSDIGAFVTCSPKRGYLKENSTRVNQFKFLVRGLSDEEAIHNFLHDNEVPRDVLIYIQPIDEVILPNTESFKLGSKNETLSRLQRDFAVQCALRNPTWKVSVQVHKVLGVR